MSAFPLRCGRLDRHEPHEWSRPGSHQFSCAGHVLIEGGYTRDADKAQDAAEEAAIRERREIA